MDVVWYHESIPLEEMYSVNIQSSLCRSSQQPKVATIYTIVILQFLVGQRCPTMWIVFQKHSQVKFIRTKYNKVRTLKYVTYSHIIYHAYYSKHYNQPAYCSNDVKIYHMLEFNEVFGMRTNVENTLKTRKTCKCIKTRGKRRKTRGKTWKICRKLQILKFSCGRGALRTEPMWTGCVSNANLQMRMRCIADADYLPTSTTHYPKGMGLDRGARHSGTRPLL